MALASVAAEGTRQQHSGCLGGTGGGGRRQGSAAVGEGGRWGENSSGLLQVHRMCPAIRQSALVDGALLGWVLTWGVWDWGQGNSSYTLTP